MSSVFISTRATKSGVRFTVRYRTGGRNTPVQHAGTYKTHTDAERVRDMVALRLAGLDDPTWPPEVPPSGISITMRWIYFARLGGLIKIGTSVDPRKRCRDLNAELLFQIPGDFARERAIHRRFAHLRERGEWFRDDASIRGYITALDTIFPAASSIDGAA